MELFAQKVAFLAFPFLVLSCMPLNKTGENTIELITEPDEIELNKSCTGDKEEMFLAKITNNEDSLMLIPLATHLKKVITPEVIIYGISSPKNDTIFGGSVQTIYSPPSELDTLRQGATKYYCFYNQDMVEEARRHDYAQLRFIYYINDESKEGHLELLTMLNKEKENIKQLPFPIPWRKIEKGEKVRIDYGWEVVVW